MEQLACVGLLLANESMKTSVVLCHPGVQYACYRCQFGQLIEETIDLRP